MKAALAALQFAFSFLTRLPVGTPTIPLTPGLAARAAMLFPLVGAALGAIAFAWQAIVLRYASAPLTSLTLVVLSALLTGGLHLDGLSDVFDGLGGYRGDRQRMLTIMRDPRIGAHGATALVLHLLAKVLVISELLERGSPWPLVAAGMWSRFCVLPLLVLFPYAREAGLGSQLHQETRRAHMLIAFGCSLGVLCAFSWHWLVPAAYSVAVGLALGLWIFKRLGGLTGDVYGAAVELSELTFLIACDLSVGRIR